MPKSISRLAISHLTRCTKTIFDYSEISACWHSAVRISVIAALASASTVAPPEGFETAAAPGFLDPRAGQRDADSPAGERPPCRLIRAGPGLGEAAAGRHQPHAPPFVRRRQLRSVQPAFEIAVELPPASASSIPDVPATATAWLLAGWPVPQKRSTAPLSTTSCSPTTAALASASWDSNSSVTPAHAGVPLVLTTARRSPPTLRLVPARPTAATAGSAPSSRASAPP